MKLLAAMSPYSEYLYEGKADVVFGGSTSDRLVGEVLTIGAIQVHFLFLSFYFPGF